MNKERVTSAKVITALKQEAYCRKLRNKEGNKPTSISSAKTSKPQTKDSKDKGPAPRRFCTFCEKEGHTLLHCRQAARILHNHKQAKSNALQGRGNSSWPAATAGCTSATPLGGNTYKSESDFFGSEFKVTVSNAVCSLFVSRAAQPSGDANLDSGCSMTMTPDLSLVHNPRSDHTPV
jgi:hypothetical protein